METVTVAVGNIIVEQSVFEELAPLVQPVEAGETIEERFTAFHKANPHVYQILRGMALRLRAQGMRHYGMKGLFEVLRWESALRTTRTGEEPWKLNNDFTSMYARKLMDEVPELADFFELRQRRGEMV